MSHRKPGSLLESLKRRGVVRAAAVYVVAAVAVSEAADVMFPRLLLPDWSVTLVVVLAVLGLPVVVGLAWAFDVTAEGIQRTPDVSPAPAVSADAPRGTAASVTTPRKRAVIWGVGLVGVAILAGGTLFALRPAGGPADSLPVAYRSLAVLPFSDLSRDGGHEYFADGLAEEILTALAQVEGLRVLAAASSFPFRGRIADARMIGDTLGVDAVLDGSVTVDDGRVRIRVQLVDAGDGSLVWSQQYERGLYSTWAVQEEIAERTVDALGFARDSQDRQLISGGTTVPAAMDYYLEYQRMAGGAIDVRRRRIELLERAVAADPTFARAWVALAGQYSTAPNYFAMSEREAFPLAEHAIDQALALEPGMYAALLTRADHLRRTGRFQQAEAGYRAALERNPNSARAQSEIARLLLGFGRTSEAVAAARRAVQVDPRSPGALHDLIATLIGDRQLGLAMDAVNRRLEMAAPVFGTIGAQVVLYAERGDFARSVELAEELVDRYPGDADALHVLAYAKVRAGSPEDAVTLLPALTGEDGTPASPTAAGLVYAYLARLDTAFVWFGRAEEEESSVLRNNLRYHSWPMFDGFRDDPRFAALLLRLGFTEQADPSV